MGALVTAGIIAGVAALGSAAVSANASKKAAQTQADALNNVKGVDINGVTAAARAADLKKYQDQFAALNQVDPVTGKLRDTTNQALLDSVQNNTNGNYTNSILKSLFNENINVDPNDAKFQQTLKTQAQQQLDLGGKLSPEYQAELVRSGLASGATAGFAAGSSASNQGVGGLLASQQIALEQQRQAMAKNLFGFATDLNTTRIANLSGIGQQALTADQVNTSKLLNLSNLVDSRTPAIGLSGGDIANLAVGNSNQANQITLQKSNVASQAAQNQAAIAAGLIGSFGKIGSTIAGGYGGTSTTGGGLGGYGTLDPYTKAIYGKT